MKNLILSAFLVWSTISVQAQLTDSISTITVSASHIPSSISQTGKNITVLTAKDIQNSSATSVDDLLGSLSGVHLNTRGAFGVQADISMRGSTYSQVLILVDNVRLNDPLTAHFNNNLPVTLAEIGQIEIIRGPASASFGTDAVGGVIHIKTKSYLRQYQKQEFSLSGEVGLGAHRQSMSNIGLLYQKDKLLFAAGVQTNISDGEQLENPNFKQGIPTDSLYQNYFDIRTYSASLAYLFSDQWNIYLRTNTTHRAFIAKSFYTQSIYDESTEETKSNSFQATIRHRKDQHHTAITLAHKSTDDLFVFNPLFSANQHKTNQDILNIHHRMNISSRIKLAFGGQFLQQTIKSTDRGDHQKNSTAIFATIAYPIIQNLNTTASLRLVYDPAFGIQPIPQLNFAYVFNEMTIRSSIGSAIRSADFTEQYISSQIANLSPGRNIGNPDLKPEHSQTIDLGIDWRPQHNTLLAATIFYRQSKDLIDYILTNSNEIKNAPNLLQNENYLYANKIANSKTTGMELQLQKQYNIHQNTLSLSGNYTYLNTTAPDGIISKYIANHPKHQLNAKIGFQHSFFDLS
ncbi:MAG TPA: TonB-dependent receptor, partial [Saprospiraceae bacterium]|nr:TonB-dependent receptor [Saprospiraceae bacterium]